MFQGSDHTINKAKSWQILKIYYLNRTQHHLQKAFSAILKNVIISNLTRDFAYIRPAHETLFHAQKILGFLQLDKTPGNTVIKPIKQLKIPASEPTQADFF